VWRFPLYHRGDGLPQAAVAETRRATAGDGGARPQIGPINSIAMWSKGRVGASSVKRAFFTSPSPPRMAALMGSFS
jgi:hypothetical protein